MKSTRTAELQADLIMVGIKHTCRSALEDDLYPEWVSHRTVTPSRRFIHEHLIVVID